MQIRKAERKKAKLRLGIAGASGSGKTWSALEIATGMGGKIGMIDTESGRGELYGEDFNYDVIRLEAPFSPSRYVEALKIFDRSGYDIVIVDSLSHAWSGEGGVLSIVDKAGGQFQSGWKVGTPQQNLLVDSLISSPMHIITTLRVKTEYVVEKNDRGKNEPRKIGLAPIQRDQMEYEFTIYMTMNQDHVAHVTKDNTKLFDQQFVKPSKEMGSQLISWLNTGLDVNDLVMREGIEAIEKSATMNDLKSTISKLKIQFAERFPSQYQSFLDLATQKKESLNEPV